MAIQGGSGGGGGRSASDVRAGGAFFEIYAKDGLTGVINKLTAKVQSFASSMRRIGGTIFGAGAALGAGPLGFLLGGISRAGDVANLSRQFQIPINLMQRLKYAADAAGTSVEDVMKNPGRFADLLAEAPITNTGDIARAVDIQREWRLTTLQLQNAMLSLLDVIAPIVRLVAEFVRANSALFAVLGLVAAGMVALGAAITIVSIGFSTVSAIVAALTTPLGLLAALGVALAIVFRKELADAFREVGEIFGMTWGGIVDAVKAGNLELAFKIVAVGVRTIWAQLMLDLRKGWNDFVTWLIDTLRKNPWILPLVGGVLGGVVGGPVGAGVGAAGGAAGAIGLEIWAKELKEAFQVGVAPQEQRLIDLQDELRKLREQAAHEAGMAGPRALPEIIRAVEAVKGGFSAGLASQQFGYGDKAGRLIDINREMLAEMKVAPDKIAGGVADALRAK